MRRTVAVMSDTLIVVDAGGDELGWGPLGTDDQRPKPGMPVELPDGRRAVVAAVEVREEPGGAIVTATVDPLPRDQQGPTAT